VKRRALGVGRWPAPAGRCKRAHTCSLNQLAAIKPRHDAFSNVRGCDEG
jgi:hypothetical protein